MSEQVSGNDEMSLQEGLAWAEFCAWSALVMTPAIWWLQGPSVSTDQYVVRTSLVVISAVVATGLRVRAMVIKRMTTATPAIVSAPVPFAETSANKPSETAR